MNCPFCLKKQTPLFEDEFGCVYIEKSLGIPGYFIVAPKFHAECLSELPQREFHGYMQLIKKTIKSLRISTNVSKIYTLSFGEIVPHFHMHLFPRYEEMAAVFQQREQTKSQPIDGAKLFYFIREEINSLNQVVERIFKKFPALQDHIRIDLEKAPNRED